MKRRERMVAAAMGLGLAGALVVATQASAKNDCQSYGSINLQSPTTIISIISDDQGCGVVKHAIRNWPTGAPNWDTYPTVSGSIPAHGFVVYSRTVSSSQLRAYRGCTVPSGIPVPCTLGSWKTNSTGSTSF